MHGAGRIKEGYLEPNNTNRKTEIQKVRNTGVKEDTYKPLKQRSEKKVIVIGDSMLNGISEKRLSQS